MEGKGRHDPCVVPRAKSLKNFSFSLFLMLKGNKIDNKFRHRVVDNGEVAIGSLGGFFVQLDVNFLVFSVFFAHGLQIDFFFRFFID